LLKNSVARNSAVMFVGTMVTNFGAYLYQLVVVRIFGPEQYSEFAALISLLFLFSVPANVLQIVLTKYFSVFYAREDFGQSRSLFVKTVQFLIFASIVALPIFLVIVPFLQKLIHIHTWESFIFLYFVIAGSFFISLGTALLNGYQKFFASSFIMSILTFIRLLSGFLFAPISVSFAILGNAISQLIGILFYIVAVRFIFLQPKKAITIKFSEILSFSFPVFLSTIGTTAFFNMDVVLVKHFFEQMQAGIYASLTIFGKIIFFASSPIILVIFPMIVERREKKKEYGSLFYFGLLGVCLLSFLIVGVYFTASQFIVEILFGKAFLDAVPYLGQYGMFMSFVTIMNYVMTVCLAINKTKAGLIVFLGSVFQSLVIVFFHRSLFEVIWGISSVTGIIILILLLYYRYGREKH
ncbi:MAG: oligosaccharide flippase family protein, partial [Patescibacteria group bacterium]|nr:oligosaccharide flippase family protein [Patescibacteria group bacterium]